MLWRPRPISNGMKKLIVANWKMNPSSLKEASFIVKDIEKKISGYKNAEIVFCPPLVYLSMLKKISRSKKSSFGAQNIFFEKEGAFTGEISGDMVKDSGGKYVILGHSESRRMGETDEIVNKKILSAIKSKLIPIVCVGEEGRDVTHQYLQTMKEQIERTFTSIPGASFQRIIIAYEPIWSIGIHAKREAVPEESMEMVIFIKRVLSDMLGKNFKEPLFLYGGSVHPGNARGFLEHGGVGGLLVGHDSLNVKKFLKILDASNDQ